ncbi:MAG: nuclear transport factor 2 family protein [Myxococcales bacterium]|nr:nuclear transport factor 2 family protein [Myxococcales bacterium]MCB9546903.1 nuclear transport factor 2 family protein [Myxococcales bacterium]
MDDVERRTRAAAQRQLDAYNAHDINTFAACYHPDVRVFDLPTGALRMQGRAALHAAYGQMFAAWPAVHAALVSRAVVGRYAYDEEVVTGRGDTPVHAMATYEVDDEGLITQVWFVLA